LTKPIQKKNADLSLIADEKGRVFLSIIIVTFNNLPEIETCLQSLAVAARGYKTQLILIDNQSSDGTAEWLTAQRPQLSRTFHSLHLQINDRNRGFTAAINQGLARAQGDTLLLLNPDVQLTEAVLPALLNHLRGADRVGVVAPQLRFADGTIQPSCRRLPRRRDIVFEPMPLRWQRSLGLRSWKMPEFDHSYSVSVDQPQGAFLLFRRSVLDAVGRLDERFFMFFSDVDWCRRVKEAGYEIWFVADVFVYHHQGSSVHRRRAAMLVTSHRSFRAYFRKYDRTFWQKTGTIIVSFILLISLLFRLLSNAVAGVVRRTGGTQWEPRGGRGD